MVESQKESKKEDKKIAKYFKKKESWMVISGILLLLLLFFVFVNMPLTKTVAGNKLVEFLNSRVGGGVTLESVKSVGNVYEVTVLYQSQSIPVYISKDGKYFIQGLTEITPSDSSADSGNGDDLEEIPQTDKPIVDLYVMSFCPYGNKAEDTMLPVYNLLKNKVDFNVRYIVSVSGTSVNSLHGQAEVDQNERELCVLSNYGEDKFWSFMTYVNANCGSDGSCWETAAKNLSMDVNKIKTCVSSKGLDLMKAEAKISGENGVSGSPTMFVNGVGSSSVYQYGNPEVYKQVICSAFSDAPAECSQVLSSDAATSTGGSC
jgi:hypothetical protein